MREPHHPSCGELELPAILHALSDPARLEIVRLLSTGPECTCGTFDLGLSKATLSHHFRVLREAGLIKTRPEGRKRSIEGGGRLSGGSPQQTALPWSAGQGPAEKNRRAGAGAGADGSVSRG